MEIFAFGIGIEFKETMGSTPKPVQLKVFVDNKKKRVMFAEAQEDFVDILFSFLTLPLGKIARLSSKHADSNSKNVKVGSLTSLYQSVVNLDVERFTNYECKAALVNPRNSSVLLCQKLKVNLDEMKPIDCSVNWDPVFVRNKASFIITDDLNVMPVLLDTTIELLNTHGVEYIDLLDERTVLFGVEEFSNLLKWSLLTTNPLTNLVLGGSRPYSFSSCIRNITLGDSPRLSSKSAKPKMVKLLVQKSNNKVLCAQVENFFVELLFSFLTIPMGSVMRLTMDKYTSPVGMHNLYNSISRMGDERHLKSDDIKTTLVSPKLASNYLHVTDFLTIYQVNTRPGNFVKEQPTFIVSDDLEVTLPPSISMISKFNTLGIPVSDIEVLEVNIGEQEALLILTASLTSTTALTDCLDALRKHRNAEAYT